MTERAAKRKVERARVKSLEKALADERLALAAITKVFLMECPDPARVLARLEAMVRAAEANPRTPAAVRKQLLDATLFVRTAVERETGRPQSLFEPHVGHVEPEKVDALVAPTDGPSQLGLLQQESVLGDAAAAHGDRVDTITAVHMAVIELLREKGAVTDRELHDHYRMMGAERGWPIQSYAALVERRKELVAAGRIASAGRKLSTKTPTWDIVERDLITRESA